MRRPRLVPVLAALTLLVATVLCARRAVESCERVFTRLNRHDVALAGTAPPLGHAPAARSRRVVLVIVDGLGHWASRGLPALDALRARGVDAIADSHAPTLSRPNYTSILTGVPPLHSGVRTNAYTGEVPLDSLPRRAAAAGLGAAFVSDIASSIARLFRGAFAEVAYASWPGGLPRAAALALARDYPLVVILLGAVDRCGHERAMASAACRAAALEIDAHLGALAAELDLRRDTLIVTADHGHIAAGGHGGEERAVVEVPLVMAGAGIGPGAPLTGARLVDVAPTIAALLGVPAPRHALGAPLLAALDLPPADRAALAEDARARIARNTAVAAAEQARSARARAARRTADQAVIAGGALALLLGLALAARLRLIRLDRTSVATGLLAPLSALSVMLLDVDHLGSLSAFQSVEQWTDHALLATGVTTAVLLAAARLARGGTADHRLTRGNGAVATTLALAALAELIAARYIGPEPFVRVPDELSLFALVAAPTVVAAALAAAAMWRVIDLFTLAARLAPAPADPGPRPARQRVAHLARCGTGAIPGPASRHLAERAASPGRAAWAASGRESPVALAHDGVTSVTAAPAPSPAGPRGRATALAARGR